MSIGLSYGVVGNFQEGSGQFQWSGAAGGLIVRVMSHENLLGLMPFAYSFVTHRRSRAIKSMIFPSLGYPSSAEEKQWLAGDFLVSLRILIFSGHQVFYYDSHVVRKVVRCTRI